MQSNPVNSLSVSGQNGVQHFIRSLAANQTNTVVDASAHCDTNTLHNRIDALNHYLCNCKDHLDHEELVVNKLSQINYAVKIIEFLVIAIAAEIISGKLVSWGTDVLKTLGKENRLPKILKRWDLNKPGVKMKVFGVSLKQIISFGLALALTRFVIKEAQHYADHQVENIRAAEHNASEDNQGKPH